MYKWDGTYTIKAVDYWNYSNPLAIMPYYTPLQAVSKNQEDKAYEEEVAVTNPATGISRRQLILVLLCMTASLVFGVDLGWQLSAHYAAKEQQLSRPSGLLSGCMKLSTFHTWNFNPLLDN